MAKPKKLNLENVKENNILTYATNTYLAAMISFFLLFTGRSGYSGITESKYRVFLFFTISYILFCVTVLLIQFFRTPQPIDFFKKHFLPASPTQYFFLLYLFFTIISSVLSEYSTCTWIGMTRYEGSLSIGLYVFTFLLFSRYYRPAKWHLYLLGISSVVFSLLSFTQLAGLNPFELYPKGLTFYDAEVAYRGSYLGTIGNVDLVAAFLTLAIPILLCLPLFMKETRIQILRFPAFGLIITLIKSKVMAGVLGLALGLVLSLPLMIPLKKKYKVILIVSIVAMLVGFLLTIKFWIYPSEGVIFELHEILNGRLDDSFGTWRVYIWRNVVKIIPERLWFGGGPDTLAVRMNVYFDTYNENQIHTVRAVIDTAHNEYLNILVNQGLFALLCYLGGLITLSIKWIRNSDNPFAAIVGCSVLCYTIQALFGFSMFITASFFWMCLGVLESSVRDNN